MARIRSVKPEFFRHEGLQDLEAEHPELRPMLVFIALWGHCDRRGVFPWQPRQLALDILPFVWKERLGVELQRCLELLESAGFVRRFEAEGKTWGWVPGFSEHQRISGKEADSAPRYPEPPQAQKGHTTETPGKHRGNTREAPGKHPGAQELGTGNGELGTGNVSVRETLSFIAKGQTEGSASKRTSPPRHTHAPRDDPLHTFNPHEREPTPDEVRTHAAMVGYPQIDAEGFLEHYRAVGWMRGSTPITDWRPLVSRWREVEKAKGGSNGRSNGKRGAAGTGARGRRRTDYDEVVEGPYDDDGDLPGELPAR